MKRSLWKAKLSQTKKSATFFDDIGLKLLIKFPNILSVLKQDESESMSQHCYILILHYKSIHFKFDILFIAIFINNPFNLLFC